MEPLDLVHAVRRDNLRALVLEYRGGREFAKVIGVHESRVSQVLNKHKPLGESAARDWEKTLKKPKNWFDVDHSAPDVMSIKQKEILAEVLAAILKATENRKITVQKAFELVSIILEGALASEVVDHQAIETLVKLTVK
jgi:plasmid maintenance system antidote protein VapI